MAFAGLTLSGCGAGDGNQAVPSPPEATAPTLPSVAAPPPDGSAPITTTPAPTRAAGAALPSVTVDDVGAGTKIDLASLSPSSRPLLVWMWAPH